MIMAIKNAIFRLLIHLYRFRLRMKGVKVPASCIINKMPYIRKFRGSSIILGENVTLTSNSRHNPLTEHPVSLRTLTPDACIEMKAHSGMSGSTIICSNKVTIGEYTIIGANTLLYDSDGHTFTQERGWNTPRLRSGRPISIGNKCFIGTRCIILGGVTIGDCCLISAGTVLTQDVPSGHKAYGNPAIIEPLPKVLGGCCAHKEKEIRLTDVQSMDNNVACSAEETVFLESLRDLLEIDFMPSMDDVFREYETWDSVSFLSVVAWLQDDFGYTLTSEQFNNMTTWRDIYHSISDTSVS